MVKEFLSQRGIAFEEHDISRDPAAAQELLNRTGQMAVPVIIIDGQAIVGFNRAALEQALSQQQKRPSLGAAVADAAKITAQQGSAVMPGAYVGSVKPGSLAEQIGLRKGDIIIELNKQHIATATDLENALSQLNKGNRLSIVFVRGNRTLAGEGVW